MQFAEIGMSVKTPRNDKCEKKPCFVSSTHTQYALKWFQFRRAFKWPDMRLRHISDSAALVFIIVFSTVNNTHSDLIWHPWPWPWPWPEHKWCSENRFRPSGGCLRLHCSCVAAFVHQKYCIKGHRMRSYAYANVESRYYYDCIMSGVIITFQGIWLIVSGFQFKMYFQWAVSSQCVGRHRTIKTILILFRASAFVSCYLASMLRWSCRNNTCNTSKARASMWKAIWLEIENYYLPVGCFEWDFVWWNELIFTESQIEKLKSSSHTSRAWTAAAPAFTANCRANKCAITKIIASALGFEIMRNACAFE